MIPAEGHQCLGLRYEPPLKRTSSLVRVVTLAVTISGSSSQVFDLAGWRIAIGGVAESVYQAVASHWKNVY